MSFAQVTRFALCVLIAAIVAGAPFLYYRASYAHHKRFREVVPGRVYRSGEMTAEGFAEVVLRHGIKTIVNLQDEYADPNLPISLFDKRPIRESEFCRQLGVQYLYLPPDLIPRRRVPAHRPAAIDQFLAFMDDPANYPVLIHCRAGMHRTGVMVAVYRMEYQGWTPREALAELKANGFTEYQGTAANDYVNQYILTYRPGVRRTTAQADRR